MPGKQSGGTGGRQQHDAGGRRIHRRGGEDQGAAPAPAQPQSLDDLRGLLDGRRPAPHGDGHYPAGGQTLEGLQSLLEGRPVGNAPGRATPAFDYDADGRGGPRPPADGGARGLDDLEALLDGPERYDDYNAAVPAGEEGDYPAENGRAGEAPRRRAGARGGAQRRQAAEGGRRCGPARPHKRPKQEDKPKKPLWKRLVLAACSLLVLGVVGFGAFFLYSTRNDDLWLDLSTIPHRTETILYYTNPQTGESGVFARLPCTQIKEYVPGDQIPQMLKDAFVAVEDRDFYSHRGVSLTRTAYAVLNEVKYYITGSYIGGDGGRRQGASTIDQQLIKNLTRDDSDSAMAGYMRKLREFCRALKLDAKYEKDEILVAYLNSISFTGNTAGVQAEAKKLFGKTVDQLSLAECASLAAITRNPAGYSPVTKPEAHLQRRNYVLSEMRDQGYITAEQAAQAAAEPLNLSYTGEPRLAEYTTSYFTDTVIDTVIGDLSSQRGITRREASNLLYNGGLRIYTTVVPELQRTMEEVMASARYHPRPTATVTGQLTNEDGAPMEDEDGKPVMGNVTVTPQAAMVSLDYQGGICAVVGGLGQKTISRGFNRATGAVRQVGSTMKAIGPYVTALEEGWITWSSAFYDGPVMEMEEKETGEKTDWPANATRTYSERDMLVREAFAKSVNTIAVRVGRQVGNRAMYEFVRGELDIQTIVRTDVAPGPLVLGSSTYGITPLEMAKAYAMFGNGGYTVTPHCYTAVTGGTGAGLLKVKNAAPRQVIGQDTAFIMNRLMGEVLEAGGTAAGMRVPGQMDSVGKTGTTSDNRDHWFIGLTPYYVTASWYGYDENIRLDASQQNHPPTLAWRAVMQQAQAGLPAARFPDADGVVQADYCTVSGRAAGAGCPRATGWYKWWQQPLPGCPDHR